MSAMQQTSLEAYTDLKERRILGQNQRIVLGIISHHVHITNKAIAQELQWPINCVTGRVKELREAGFVESAGKVVQVNRRKALVWRLMR